MPMNNKEHSANLSLSDKLSDLRFALAAYGEDIDLSRCPVQVVGEKCIEDSVPAVPGVYWIETTMPVKKLHAAISAVADSDKRIRKKPPKGTNFIEQSKEEFYVAYSGTEENLRKR